MQTNNKLRETLKQAKEIARTIYSTSDKGSSHEELAEKIVEIAHAALAAPPRNCEVGTAEEQAKRFMAVCESVKPAEPHYSETGEVLCPSIGSGQECKLGICNYGQCALKWAQMPYEEKEGGAK